MHHVTRFASLAALVAVIASSAGAAVNRPTVRSARQAVSYSPPFSPSGFGSMRVRFEHSLIADDGILVANYAQRYGITTIFVQLGGDDIAGLVDRNPNTVRNLQAMIGVANVYLVVGDSSWFATPGVVPSDATKAAAIAHDYPKVAGVLYDIDPVSLPGWYSTERGKLVAEYLTLVNTLLTMPNANSLRSTQFVADVQFATVSSLPSGTGPTVLQALEAQPGIAGLQLQTPGNSALEDLKNAAPSIAQLTIPFSIVASTSKYAPASYYGVAPEYLLISLVNLTEHVAQANPNFRGITVDGWNDLYNGLQSVLAQPPVFSGALANGPLAPAAGSTYLGAFVNPMGIGQSISQTSAFESAIGRRLAFNLHFYQWTTVFPTSSETDDVKNGRIPILAWNCGDTDSNVVKGLDDALIGQRADAIKAFGSTVMLRWFWEMNLNDANDPPRRECWDADSDLAGGYFAPLVYIAAWDHVRAVFAAHGVTNVVWLWCVANAHGGSAQYYPGDDQVDWVSLDDYDTNDVSLASTLLIPTYPLAQFQEKPFMLNETGAHAANQASYFSDAAGFFQTRLPWIRAVGYFDSVGTAQNWVLSGEGFSSFKSFANSAYMRARESDQLPSGFGSRQARSKGRRHAFGATS